MDRSNHYEAAFEALLRERGIGFVAMDETHRSTLGESNVKSVDFIIVVSAKLVVDVKGRRFPGGTVESPRKVRQNWSTEDDIDGLARWAAHFGSGFREVLAFVYLLPPPFAVRSGTPDEFEFRGSTYLMRAVDASAYRDAMRPRSRRLNTVHLSTTDFRRLVRPFTAFLEPMAVPHDSATVTPGISHVISAALRLCMSDF